MNQFFIEFFSCFSRLVNVLLGGQASLSLSARVHRDQLSQAEAVIDWVFYVAFGQVDHCRSAWAEAVARSCVVRLNDAALHLQTLRGKS